QLPRLGIVALQLLPGVPDPLAVRFQEARNFVGPAVAGHDNLDALVRADLDLQVPGARAAPEVQRRCLVIADGRRGEVEGKLLARRHVTSVGVSNQSVREGSEIRLALPV